jgi:hypothetical protein
VEFHRVVFGPVDFVHAEQRAEELVAGGQVAVVEAAEDGEDRVGEEDELAAGAQEAGGLGDRRKSRPNSSWQRRAVASWASELSMPTGRAPRRASQAET